MGRAPRAAGAAAGLGWVQPRNARPEGMEPRDVCRVRSNMTDMPILPLTSYVLCTESDARRKT